MKHKAHLGLVHLDWHPEEKHWLATASRDRQIYVCIIKIGKFYLTKKRYNLGTIS